MCFPVASCFFCIRLDVATKIIGFIYTVLGSGLVVLFGVPVVALWDQLPVARLFFYGVMALSSIALCLTSGVLVYAECRMKPRLLWVWVASAWCTGVPLALVCVAGMVTVSFRAEDLQAAAAEGQVISAYFSHALMLYYCASVVNSRRAQMLQERRADAHKRLMYPIMYNVHSV